jgi:hypothetical protein
MILTLHLGRWCRPSSVSAACAPYAQQAKRSSEIIGYNVACPSEGVLASAR